MKSIVMMAENVKPKGEMETIRTVFQRLHSSRSSGSRKPRLFAAKKMTATTMVTACPIMVAHAAPAIPQLKAHTKA